MTDSKLSPAQRNAGRKPKLTVEQVTAIRDTYAAGLASMRDLGREFGVNHGTIHHVIHRPRRSDRAAAA